MLRSGSVGMAMQSRQVPWPSARPPTRGENHLLRPGLTAPAPEYADFARFRGPYNPFTGAWLKRDVFAYENELRILLLEAWLRDWPPVDSGGRETIGLPIEWDAEQTIETVYVHPEAEAVWQTFQAHLPPRTASVRTLILLDGCSFPVDRFPLLGRTVRRFSDSEIRELGPSPDVAETFFPNESIDPRWFYQQWFLEWSHAREEKSGSSWWWPFGYDVISTSWQPLLALALYKIFPFAVPIVLEAETGWTLRRVLWSDPWFDSLNIDGEAVEVPTHFYEVGDGEWERFTSFLKLYETGVERVGEDRSVPLAGRRFLRALFAAGPWTQDGSDVYEDALLQYVFALEALLTLGERGAIGYKLAARAAWLIGGRDDSSRERILRLVTNLYRHRGDIVHGQASSSRNRKSERGTLLVQARDLVRQVLVVLVSLRAELVSAEAYSRTLADLPVSRTAQDRAIGAASRSLRLTDARLDPYA